MNVRSSKDERIWAMLCHVVGLVGSAVVMVGQIIGPLIIWLVKKEQHPLVDDQGKEALNFQISMTIYHVITLLLWFLVVGFFLTGILAVFEIMVVIIAAIQASAGVRYRYPLCIRFIK